MISCVFQHFTLVIQWYKLLDWHQLRAFIPSAVEHAMITDKLDDLQTATKCLKADKFTSVLIGSTMKNKLFSCLILLLFEYFIYMWQNILVSKFNAKKGFTIWNWCSLSKVLMTTLPVFKKCIDYYHTQYFCLSIHYMVSLFIRAPFYLLLVFIAMCAVFWLFWLSYQYLPSDWLERLVCAPILLCFLGQLTELSHLPYSFWR